MNFLDCDDVRRFLAENRDDGTQLWAFHHLPRTGGTSLVTEVAGRLQPNYNVYIAHEVFNDRWDPETAIEPPFRRFLEAQKTTAFRFVFGHLLRPQIEQLRTLTHARIFTIVRDPVQQILSIYRFHQSRAFPGHRWFIEQYPDFESFLEDPGQQNPVGLAIGGRGATAAECRDILLRDYVFCGLFEQLLASMAIIGSLLGFDIPDQMLHLNAAAPVARDDVEDVAPYRDRILARNAIDAEIHRFVYERFHERLDQMPAYLTADTAQPAMHGLARHYAIAEKNVRRLMDEIEARDTRLVAAHEDIGRLVAKVEERDARLTAADKDLRRLIGEVEERNARLAAADADLRRLVGEVEQRDARLAEADKDLRRLIGEAEERDARLATANQDLRRLIGEVEERDARLAAADQDLRRLVGEAEERDARLAAADQDLRRLIGEVAERNARLAAADQDLRRLIGEVEERNARLAAADKDLRRLIGEIEQRN
jgi:ABC-type transporter Mla subunit MlaD